MTTTPTTRPPFATLAATLLLGATLLAAACSKPKLIKGTKIPDTARNREVIAVAEKYRKAFENRKGQELMAMAHRHYYEHSGTHTGQDDYGYAGLLKVIRNRMSQLQNVRYSLKYMRINWTDKKQAELEVYISATFQIKVPDGSRWHRFTDYNKLVLVKEKGRWQFLRGM